MTAGDLERLAALLERCVLPPPPLVTTQGATDGDAAGAGALTPAAVLVPLVVHPSGVTVLLTRRTAHLEAHPGQVSFPGGHVEPHDPDYPSTALRETEEEIGLARDFVHVVGALEECRTGTGYRVTPVLGLVRPGFILAPDRYEVAEVFEVPLPFILDPRNRRRCGMVRDGVRREYWLIEYQNRPIWGATAAILVNFHARAEAAELLPALIAASGGRNCGKS